VELSRRRFFGLFGGVAASAIIAPKIYVFAPPTGWNGRFDVLNLNNWENSQPLELYEAAVESIELEQFALEIPNLIPHFKSLYMKPFKGARYDAIPS
jgi:hypothetical protein